MTVRNPALGRTRRPGRYTAGQRIGWVYILPWIIGLLVFKLYPFASSLAYSFTDFHLFKGITQTGWMNYESVFTTRKIRIRGLNFFRTMYYVPSILGGSVAIAVLWKALFRDEGVVNTLLATLGIQGPTWLSDPQYAIWIICLLRVWQFGSAMVLFLAALKGVPEELYEAATIDGAGKAKQFIAVTLPLITPVVFYNLITQLCIAFQEFNGPYIITNGGPRNSTTLISILVYNYAFKSNQMGMASALAWIMFVIVCILTIIAFTSQKKWVYYSDER